MITGIDDPNLTAKERWAMQRIGKFTASESFKLLVGSRDKKNMFGEGAITYIETKAMEMGGMLWESPAMEELKTLRHGKMYEYPAYMDYVRATRMTSIEYYGTEEPLFLDHEKFIGEAGASPDLVLRDSDKKKIIFFVEMKCPANPLFHFRRLFWKDQFDLKEEYILCYTQIQHTLMITEADMAQFYSFDERRSNPKEQRVIIDVKPDIEFQENLDKRLTGAIKLKYELLDQLKEKYHALR